MLISVNFIPLFLGTNLPRVFIPVMSTRTKGYVYRRRADGTRYRVYRTKGRSNFRPRSTYRSRSRPSFRYRSIRPGQYSRIYPSKVMRNSKPMMRSSVDGRVIVAHSEYIQVVPSAQSFAIATFPINPGISATFPWLSTVAKNFEEWVPRRIFFEFRSTCADQITTTTAALGQVSMATQYNSLDANFANNVQLLNYENASSAKPSNNFRHYLQCKRSQTAVDEMYIRTGAIPANADLRLYDLGKTGVSSAGIPGTDGTPIGQLWIHYEVELRKPRIAPA